MTYENCVIVISMSGKPKWTIDKIKESFDLFFKEFSKYPTCEEIDKSPYFPRRFTIDRIFGSVTKARKELGLEVLNYAKLKGKNPWNKGIKRPDMSGEKHPNWVKDRTKLKRYQQDERRSSIYVTWRNSVKKRDNFKCKISNSECEGKLEVHHILGFKDHPELRYDINNGITLCYFHHPRKRKDEKELSPYFQQLVMNMK